MNISEDDSPFSAISVFCKILDELNIAYLIGGSFASSVHGEFRTTNDIDFLIDISESTLPSFFQSLGTEFIFDPVSISRLVKEKSSFNIFHEATFIKLDVFTRIDTYRREQLSRAVRIAMPDTSQEIMVASPEDIILNKLAWYKLGNFVSERQWHDILGVLRVQNKNLDRQYMEIWAEHLEVTDLLKKATEDVGC